MFSVAYLFLWMAGAVASAAVYAFTDGSSPSERLGAMLIPIVITLFITAVCKGSP